MAQGAAPRHVHLPPARKQRKAPMTPGSCGMVSDMPTIDATRLESTATRIFEKLGAPTGDAAWIAHLLVLANLRGHDSHGVIRIPQYAQAVKTGGIDPKSPVTVVAETPVTARLDGGRGFGQVVARRGIELCITKAKASGLAAVALSRTTHVGRLADYAEMAAAQGLVGMLWVNAVHGLNVAPWGGAARRLGTNPHAIGIPGAGAPAMVLDFATSVVAEGKMRVKKNRKQQAPPGWFIDAEGRPANDPEIFYGDPVGSLLTSGDPFPTAPTSPERLASPSRLQPSFFLTTTIFEMPSRVSRSRSTPTALW